MRIRTIVAFAFLVLVSPVVAAQDLFDTTLLRTYRLTFHQADWWNQLVATKVSGVYIKADLEVDGQTLVDVGVRMRGQASFFCAPGQKKPLRIKLDAFVPGQELYGYDTFRLNNAAGDPTFLREALMSRILSDYIPMARRAFGVLELNGGPWGVYILEEQKDGRYADEWFGDGSGNRYKAVYPAGLQYLGQDPTLYAPHYGHVNGPTPNAYEDLRDLCDVINNTSVNSSFDDALLPFLDVDGVHWHCVGNNLFGNLDSYQGNTHNYYVLQDAYHDRMHFQIHDLDLSFGTWSVLPTAYSLTAGFNVQSRRLTNRLYKKNHPLQEYYAHMKTMAEDSFDWDIIGPIAWEYHNLIDAAVAADTKKIYSYQQFKDGITMDTTGGTCWNYFIGLKRWVEERQAHVLGHPDITIPRPELGEIRHSPGAPTPSEVVYVTVEVVGSEPVSLVELRYRRGRGYFVRTPMFDDGLNQDGPAGDGVFGAPIPAGEPGMRVEYVVVGVGATSTGYTFMPRKSEADPYAYTVSYGGEGMRVTEYMYSGNGDEFLELTNTSAAPMDLAGWSLDDASGEPGTFDLSGAGVVPAGGSVVVTEGDAALFKADWGLSPAAIVLGGNTVAKLGRDDVIHIFDQLQVTQDRLGYGDQDFPGSIRAADSSGWPCGGAVGADDPYKLQLSFAGDSQGSWTSQSGDVGNPGSFTATPCPDLGAEYCTSNPNSTGSPAILTLSGSAVIAHNDLVLTADSVPANQFGYALMSDAQGNVPGFGGSQGVLCLGSPIVRFARDVLSSGPAGQLVFSPNLNYLPNDVVVAPGESWNFQFWFRDGGSSNTSSGVEVTLR